MPIQTLPFLVTPANRVAVTARFEAKSIRDIDPNSCWGWRGSLDKKGYAQIGIGQKWVKAHRVSYEIYCGPIPDGLYVLHSCDNPACTNPRHLRTGTARQNTSDSWARDRSNHRKLTPEQVLEIRASNEPQKVLAKRFGVHQGHISHVKTRNRGDAILLMLAEV